MCARFFYINVFRGFLWHFLFNFVILWFTLLRRILYVPILTVFLEYLFYSIIIFQEREAQFKEYEAKHLGNRGDIAAKIEKDTERQLAEMNKNVADKKDNVGLIFIACPQKLSLGSTFTLR